MNILDLRLNNEELNEVLKDDFFIEAFELANEIGYVSCSMLQKKYSISYPKARALYEVMSLFKGVEYYDKDYKMRVHCSPTTIERVKNKEIEIDKNFKRINYIDD